MTFEDWKILAGFQMRHHGVFSGFVRSFKSHYQRRFSRTLLSRYITPTSQGLELGAGEQTIAPVAQTLFSDAYATHAGAKSLAHEFFPAETIPYPNEHFDFLLNEHVLEHIPDPIRALREWKRVLKSRGVLFLFLPHPERTFDRYRQVTSLDHLREDFDRGSTSSEDAHWDEWKSQVIDRGLAPHYSQYDKQASLTGNLIHRHVFVPETTRALLESEGWTVLEVLDVVPDRSDSFAVIARVSR